MDRPSSVVPCPLLNGFFEFLRCPESDLLARLDLNRLAGGRIAAHARGTAPHLQNAQPADADALALFQVLDDLTHQAAQDGFRLFLRQLVVFRETRRKMLQRHGSDWFACHETLLDQAFGALKMTLTTQQLDDSAAPDHACFADSTDVFGA